MTNTAQEATSATQEPEQDPAGTQGQQATSEAHNGSEPQGESFSREYVTGLREESRQRRTEAQEAQQRADWLETEVRRLATREAVRGVLADPEALSWSDDFTGEDGLPDQSKITDAAEALIKAKPYLARVRGDVGQGHHSEQPNGVSLSELLRAG